MFHWRIFPHRCPSTAHHNLYIPALPSRTRFHTGDLRWYVYWSSERCRQSSSGRSVILSYWPLVFNAIQYDSSVYGVLVCTKFRMVVAFAPILVCRLRIIFLSASKTLLYSMPIHVYHSGHGYIVGLRNPTTSEIVIVGASWTRGLAIHPVGELSSYLILKIYGS